MSQNGSLGMAQEDPNPFWNGHEFYVTKEKMPVMIE
jgi:hypothetical protein